MAWARQLPSGKWQAGYRDSTGSRVSAGTYPRKKQAEDAAAVAENEDRLNPLSPEARKITWSEWRPRWDAGRRLAASTKIHDDRRIDQRVEPKWGDVKLRDIGTYDIQTWLTELEKNEGLAPSTVIKIFHLLSNSLKAAVAANLLARNPCQGVKLPKFAPQPERYIGRIEFAEIRACMSARDNFAIDLLAGTGMRLGEAIGLHWDDVGDDAILVRCSWDDEGKAMKSPKSYAIREVPIGADLADALAKELKRRGPGKPAPVPYERGLTMTKGLVLQNGRVLRGQEGTPFIGNNLRDRWLTALSKANAKRVEAAGGNADSVDLIRPARLHDIRHTYASNLVRAGVPLEAVRVLLGHASIITTQRYADVGQSQWAAIRAVANLSHASSRSA